MIINYSNSTLYCAGNHFDSIFLELDTYLCLYLVAKVLSIIFCFAKFCNSIISISLGGNYPRRDAMANYPFVDNTGTVGNVLSIPGSSYIEEPAVDLSKITLPGRMRLITKVYNEICSSGGKVGMKHADIPVALRVSDLFLCTNTLS